MAKQIINVGTPDKGNGDPIRTAFNKVNSNFTELYTALGLNDTTLNLGSFEFNGSTMSTTDSSAIVIDQAVTVASDLTVGGDILPQTANGGDLGSLARPWKTLYVSNQTIYLGSVPLSLEEGTNELRVNNVPISQNISYTDIPNAPTDVADLTDTGNLLGGGGNANIGDFVFSDNFLTVSAGDQVVIQGETDGDARIDIPDNNLAENSKALTISNSGAQGVKISTGGNADNIWEFDNRGVIRLPADGDIIDSNGQSVLGGGSYTPDEPPNWDSPTVNTIQAALDELAARMTAFENFEIDGGNAYTPAFGELEIDGNGA